MANKEKGEVSITALGKDWTMVLSTNAMCELEDASGMTAIELASSLEDQTKMSMSKFRLLVWSCLIDRHEDEIDVKKVGKIIDDIGMKNIGEYVGQVFTLAFPPPEDGETSREGKAKAVK